MHASKDANDEAEIAKNIWNQLGHQAFAMMGAKHLCSTGNGLKWKVGGNAKRITHVKVTLDPSDTYTVEFFRVGRSVLTTNSFEPVSSFSDVYCDGLHDLISSETGLDLRFPRIVERPMGVPAPTPTPKSVLKMTRAELAKYVSAGLPDGWEVRIPVAADRWRVMRNGVAIDSRPSAGQAVTCAREHIRRIDEEGRA